MAEPAIVKSLRNIIPSDAIEASILREGQIYIRINKDNLRNLIKVLTDEGFTHLAGITALETDNEFELLYHLTKERTLLTVRVNLNFGDDVAPTITDIIPGALVYEREAHDLFGIIFEGHLNLEHFILPDDWPRDIHPMRKSQIKEKSIPTEKSPLKRTSNEGSSPSLLE